MSPSDTFEFLVQGSAAEPYVISFRRRDAKNISAYCTCPAGESGMSCKHRIRILRGLIEGIVSSNSADVTVVAGGSPVLMWRQRFIPSKISRMKLSGLRRL
jgi:hypothetical protein